MNADLEERRCYNVVDTLNGRCRYRDAMQSALIGSKIQKTRPCLIISPDELNGIIRRVIVAPMTSRRHPAPFRVATDFRRKPELILIDQIRTVDRGRLVKRLGAVDQAVLASVLVVLRDVFAE